MYLFRYIECMEIHTDGMKLIVYVTVLSPSTDKNGGYKKFSLQ